MSKPRVGSLFSGVGGLDLGLERAGWDVAFQIENDPACRRVLARHWPDVPRWGDIREVDGAALPPVDLLMGGWPCQDHSVAGRRAGLDGQRSGLFYQFARLVAECRPRWVLAENVPGLLSQPEDFRAVLCALDDLGYVGGWRVLDAQFFGVPQRRRRVFLVAGAGADGARAAAVLFEPESGRGHPAPRRETGARVAASLTAGAHSPGVNEPGRHSEDDVNLVVASTLVGGAGSPRSRGKVNGENADVNLVTTYHVNAWDSCAKARHAFEADHARCLDSSGGYAPGQGGTLVAYQCHGNNVGPLGTLRQGNGGLTSGVPFVAHALSAHGHGRYDPNGEDYVLPFDTTQVTSDKNYSAPQPGDPCHPLAAGAHAPAIAFHQTQDPISGDVAPRLGATSLGMGAQQGPVVRRLTPVECHRLMGLPDDWCAGETDSTQYRLLGNSVVVPVVQWLGERLLADR